MVCGQQDSSFYHAGFTTTDERGNHQIAADVDRRAAHVEETIDAGMGVIP